MRCDLDVGRYELKYVVPRSRRAEVIDLVAPHVRPDPNARPLGDGGLGYEVHTLYLDTANLTDYFERLEGRRVRSRLRVRTYGSCGGRQPVFLEHKRKLGRWVVKHRARACDAETWCGSGGPHPWCTLADRIAVGGRFALRFLRLADGGRSLPVSIVHYQREVMVPVEGDWHHTRLTLDRLVRATVAPSANRLFAPADVELIPPDWMIMELKFAGQAPGWMRALCRQLGIGAVAVSKASLSVALGMRADRREELRMLTPHPLLEALPT